MKHRTPIQIRFKDIDALGHVNNANHLTYFEYARIIYFNDTIGGDIDWEKEGMILASSTVNYKQPILLTDKVSVLCWLTKIGRTSFEMSYEIVKEVKGDDIVLATGSSVMVCYSYEKKSSIEVPVRWREKMEKLIV